MKNCAITLYFFVVLLLQACGQTVDKGINLPVKDLISAELVVSGLQNPWGMDFLPDGAILVTEKGGELFICKNGNKQIITGIPEVKVLGQGGLMDVELHPKFTENNFIYLSYASPEGEGRGANTAIMRAKLEGNRLTNQKVLYKAEPNTGRGQHLEGDSFLIMKDTFIFL